MPTIPTRAKRIVQEYKTRNGFVRPLPDSTSITRYGPIDLSSVKSGSKNPSWRRNIKDGVSATTSYDATHYDFKTRKTYALLNGFSIPPGSNPYLVKEQETIGEVHAGYPDFNYPLLVDATAADNIAKARLYAAIRSAQTKMSGQVFLGELREALHMIKHPLQGLRRGIADYLVRLDKRARGRHSKSSRKRALQDTWLEYSFGWMPFINDLKDAHEAYQSICNRLQHTRVSAVGVDRSYAYHSDLSMLASPSIYFRIKSVLKREISVKYVAGLSDVVSGKSDASLVIDSFGLGLNEFIPTAWELLPFSFVTDYFTNVGAILAAVHTDTSNVRWISRTVRSVVTQEGNVVLDRAETAKQLGPYFITSNFFSSDGKWELQKKRVTRSASGLSPPSLTVTCPSFDSLKWVNLAALFTASKKLLPYY